MKNISTNKQTNKNYHNNNNKQTLHLPMLLYYENELDLI